CALNSGSSLSCARWMRPASSGLFCAMFSRMAACIAAPSAFMPADARVVATAVVVFFMVSPFGVVLSFYLLLYMKWRVGANTFPPLFVVNFPCSATRRVGGGHNRHCHHVCNKRGVIKSATLDKPPQHM